LIRKRKKETVVNLFKWRVIAPYVFEGGGAGPPGAQQNGLQAFVFEDEYIK